MTSPNPGTESAPAPACAACGALITGKFCSHCGTAADLGACPGCGAQRSAGARFCHRCGAPVRGKSALAARERLAWIVAGSAVLAAGLALVWRVGSVGPAAQPAMGNAGNVVAGPGVSQRAPDISGMSPEQRFNALFERVVRSAERGDTLAVLQFSPMALGAYALLDSTNNDLRFHAALIDLAAADFAAAAARADTILAQQPGHLFGYVIRGEVAERRNQADALARSYRDFTASYDAELRAGRQEYAEHRPILDDFLNRARASTREN